MPGDDTAVVDQARSEGPAPGPSSEAKERQAGGDDASDRDHARKGGKARKQGGPTSLEGAAAHLLTAGAGWLALSVVRLFKRQQRKLSSACAELEEAQQKLNVREQELQSLQQKLDVTTSQVEELSASQVQLQSAKAELGNATERCHEAALFLSTTMSDLKVTQTELQAARSQLQSAFNELSNVKLNLEDTQGELGLTRSENELLKRELERTHRQLNAAQSQLERYHHDSMHRAGAESLEEGW